jgi:Kef-type K+ transport system membrane component KefB
VLSKVGSFGLTSHQGQLLFLDLALIVVLARGLGALAVRVGQPPVVGEIVAGILLGPTLFGGTVADAMFPPAVRQPLAAMANVGVALFMFAVGLEIEHQAVRGRKRLAALSALGSTVLPFALGLLLAAYVLDGHAPAHRHTTFMIFVGLSVSVTAFPVLARILADRRLTTTALGTIALATAAIVDVIAWIGLAVVQAAAGGTGGHWRVALIVAFAAAMMLVVRPLLRRYLAPRGTGAPLTTAGWAVVLTGALLSAAATEAIGIHPIFGAFLFGMAMPREGTTALLADVHHRVGQLTGLLLPIYFVIAGLQVDLGRLHAAELTQLGAILLVAVAGKFGGTYLGARLQRLPSRPATALATLMNTRGLTELIILGIGLQIGLLDRSLYSLMVAMAVVTTVMTGPLLALIYTKPVEVPAAGRTKRTEPAGHGTSPAWAGRAHGPSHDSQ